MPDAHAERLARYAAAYRAGLLEDTLPFWLPRSVDREYGGFLTAFDRDGTLLDTDKGIWQQGRFSWLLGTLAAEVEPRDEWLALCRHGTDFLDRHGCDDGGRMWFQVDRRGAPLRRRRYAYSEAFASLAYAAHARANGDQRARDRALDLFRRFVTHVVDPPKTTSTRPAKVLGVPMITLGVAQELRALVGFDEADVWIDRAIDEIRSDFVKPDRQAVMETVGPGGEVLDHFDGRALNPGHALECAWFVLREARARGDSALTRLGCDMLDWSWERGWDPEHGGLFYFVDLAGGPVQEYWHDMKFWWPHAEAILATLYAFACTGEEEYLRRHARVHDWAHAHFHDPEHGEWFGWLHRDGTRSSTAKGNLWKGPFHVPRMQLRAWRLCEELAAPGSRS